MNLSKNVKITKLNNYASAATTAIEGTVVDMANYDGVVFLTSLAVANAGNYIKVQSGTDATVTDAADLTGTKVISTTNNMALGVDLYKPLERYVRVYVTRGSSSACDAIWAIQYKGRKAPVTNTGVETHVSPAEGTA